MTERATGRRGRWLAAEFVVIVIGILSASVVDDWRTERADRASAETALLLIARDLAQDSNELAIFQRSTAEQRDAGLRLVEGVSGLPPDSVVELAMTVMVGWNFRSATAAFESLRASGGFELIDDAALLNDILNYYGDTAVFLDDLRANLRQAEDEFRRAVQRHVQVRRAADGGNDWVLVTSVQALDSDPLVAEKAQNVVWKAGALDARISRLFLPATTDLRASILGEG